MQGEENEMESLGASIRCVPTRLPRDLGKGGTGAAKGKGLRLMRELETFGRSPSQNLSHTWSEVSRAGANLSSSLGLGPSCIFKGEGCHL